MKDKKMLSEIYCLNKEMNRNISRIANFVVMIFMWIAKNDFDKKGDEKGKKLAGFGLMVMAIANILLMIEDGIDMVRELIGKDELECEDDEFEEVLKENVDFMLKKLDVPISTDGFSIVPIKGKKVVQCVFEHMIDANIFFNILIY